MAHEESKAHDQGPRNQENPPPGPRRLNLQLRFNLRARPRLLQQTFTYGPDWSIADLEPCDLCGARVARATLEEIRGSTLGGRPFEVYACRSCGAELRGQPPPSPPLPAPAGDTTQMSGEPAAETPPAGRVGGSR